MDEETYREHFEVGEDEIAQKWPIIESIFKVSPLQKRHDYDAWPRFPASIVQESCDLALLGKDLFLSKSQFEAFKDMLAGMGEDGFMILVRYGSGVEKQYELFYYPTDIPWTTFKDDNAASLAIALSVLDHYVIGASGRWGMFFVEPWNVYVVGYKDDEILQALQHAYDLEERGAEIVDSLPKELDAKRLHEIADEIRAQEAKS